MDRPFASHICGVLAGQDLVLLDLTSGDYELLAGLGAVATLSDDRRSIKTDDSELVQSLQSMNLLASSRTAIGRPLPPSPARSALRTTYTGPCRLEDRLWMAQGWIHMLRHAYGQGFTSIVAKARKRSASTWDVDENRLVRLAETFDRLSVWTPFQGECFYRCQMLLQLLGPLGASVDWVFGVRTWPFYAHCWLQAEDLVLTDQPERLAMFSPILTI